MTNRPIEAMYRIQADTAVVGSAAAASVTVIRDGKAASGVSVYANDVLLGVTDENGRIDISSLTAAQGSVNLQPPTRRATAPIRLPCTAMTLWGMKPALPIM